MVCHRKPRFLEQPHLPFGGPLSFMRLFDNPLPCQGWSFQDVWPRMRTTQEEWLTFDLGIYLEHAAPCAVLSFLGPFWKRVLHS